MLVVDDNATNRRILSEHMKGWDIRCDAAFSGAQALMLLRASLAGGDRYRAVVVDSQMPEMDGFTLVQAMQGDADLSHMPVMMLTSADRRGDLARCCELGIECYLTKPVRRSELLRALDLLLSGHHPHGGRGLITRSLVHGTPRTLKILVAEDNAVNQTFLCRTLERMGHRTQAALNGKEALAMIQAEAFDLVFMDVQMPEMDGLAATRAIREWEGHTNTHVPIIAMTAHAMKGDRETCLAAGMDDYLSKPAKIADIERVTQQVCRHTAETLTPERQADPEPVSKPSWDREAALQRVGGDEVLLNELIEVFFEQFPKQSHRLNDAIARNDLAAVRDLAHTLKGSLGYLCASDAAKLAQQIEKSSEIADQASMRGWIQLLLAQVHGLREVMNPPAGAMTHGPDYQPDSVSC